MRAMYLLVVLALLAAVSEGSGHAGLSSNSLRSEAHACCASATCSAEQQASLRARMSAYDGADAHSTRTYVELALSGAGCTGSARAKRAGTDFVRPVCNQGPYDVQYGSVSASCTLNVQFAAGVYYTGFYAYTITSGQYYEYVYPVEYYSESNATSFSRKYTLSLHQFASDGVYYVTAYVYSNGYLNYLSGNANFTVAKTKNDDNPPVLTAFGPSIINLNDDNKVFTFSATDDVTGVASLNAYCGNSTGTVAYGYWSAQSGSAMLNASSSFTLYLYAGTVTGTYACTLYVYDVLGLYRYYSTAQLASIGVTSSIILASNDCAAGTSRPYNTTGACTPCVVGMYAKAGAFKCMTCPPGTSSSVTGATSCAACPAGQYGIGASWACGYCTPGTYTYSPGSAFCRPCAPGQNTNFTGATTCDYCPAGMYSTGGAATCTPCAPGTYSTGYAAYCSHCIPGTYASSSGNAYCSSCSAGTYSGLGQSSCTSCPSPRVLGTANSNSQLNCYQS